MSAQEENDIKQQTEEQSPAGGEEPEEVSASNASSPGPDASSAEKNEENVEDSKPEGMEEKKQDTSAPVQHDWQAIYSPQHNAYYFYNAKTQETTWTNPLVSENAASSSAETSTAAQSSATGATSTSAHNPALDGIDPDLVYLDPTMAVPGMPKPTGSYAARFNARTGRFTAMDARDPTHMSEYERMTRQSGAFFDVGAWEKEVAERKAQEAADAAEGKRRNKRPTKADLVCTSWSLHNAYATCCWAIDKPYAGWFQSRHSRHVNDSCVLALTDVVFCL